MTLFILGLAFNRYPPKNINSFSGYRTTRAMKNIDTWKEANRYSSKLLFRFSLVLLAVTTVSVILAGKSYDYMAIAILISVILSVVFLFVSIVKTEKHLKDMFGE
jgi:Predicted integral membrane protein